MEGDLNRAMWVQNIGQLIAMPFLQQEADVLLQQNNIHPGEHARHGVKQVEE